MHLLIVQYGGDYREAFYRLAEGKGETYYAQKYSIDAVASLASCVEEVITLCCSTQEVYDEVLPNGVRALGAGMEQGVNFKVIKEIVEKLHPTHLILRTPAREILNWGIRNNIPTLVTLADSFLSKGLRSRIRNFLLANLLNSKQIHWVGNHGIPASRALQEIGVDPQKIIPWDWPHPVTPEAFAPKALRSETDSWNLVYVGSISEPKGVGDIFRAMASLRSKHLPVRLKLAGKGDIEYFHHQAKELNIENSIEFLGVVEHRKVVELMRDADLVLIPSQHEYPEGFPMTIYEALVSRTPIIASDHPMFLNHLKGDNSAILFPSGNSNALAASIEKVFNHPELYYQLSHSSYTTWSNLQIPVKWGEFVDRWINDCPENHNWLSQHCLSSGLYAH